MPYPGSPVLTQLARFAVYSETHNVYGIQSKYFKQIEVRARIQECASFGLFVSLPPPPLLWQHRLYLENIPLHCTASRPSVLNLELPLPRCNSETTLIAVVFFFSPSENKHVSGPFAPNFATLWYFSIPASLSPSSKSLKTHCEASDHKMKPSSFLPLFMSSPPTFLCPPVYEFLPLPDAFRPSFLFSQSRNFLCHEGRGEIPLET